MSETPMSPRDILQLSDKIRLRSALDNRQKLMIKQNNILASQDQLSNIAVSNSSSRQCSNDEALSPSPDNRHDFSNNSRITSALSASPSSRERNTCWRNIIKDEPMLLCSSTNRANRITASEMCKFSGHQCKFCCCRMRIDARNPINFDFSNSLNSQFQYHRNLIDLPVNKENDPFSRVTSSKKTVPSTSAGSLLNSRPITRLTSELYFVNLKQLEGKLYNGIKDKPKNINELNRLKSAEKHNSLIMRYKNVCQVNFIPPPKDILQIYPPLMPIVQQKHANSFFV